MAGFRSEIPMKKSTVGSAGRSPNNPTRPQMSRRAMAAGYRQMAVDERRELDADEWVDGVIEDIAHEPEPNARN
jgi:hypothetical protein